MCCVHNILNALSYFYNGKTYEYKSVKVAKDLQLIYSNEPTTRATRNFHVSFANVI